MMLQQTQVLRVIPKYASFIKKFPSAKVLSKAPLSEVLKEWSGLGYNRRAKYLHEMARVVTEEHGGRFPKEYPSLRALPGVGQYTANAVRVFAYNEPEVLVETNVRTAVIHHFFSGTRTVDDFEVEKIAAAAATQQDPRRWHSALFDYGAHLKASGVRNNSRSKHYTKQSRFKGSLREVRGAILRTLHNGPSSLPHVGVTISHMRKALEGLERDGLIRKEKGKWRIV